MKLIAIFSIVFYLIAGGIVISDIISKPQKFSCPDQSAWLNDKIPQRWLLEALK